MTFRVQTPSNGDGRQDVQFAGSGASITRILSTAMTSHDYGLVAKAAHKEGLSISAFARKKLLKGLTPQK